MNGASKSLPKYIFVLIVFFVLFQLFLPMVYIVDGVSMEPTFNAGDITIIDYYGINKKFSNGDIVVINNDSQHTKMIKRIIGSEGDHVIIKDNQVYVNEELLEEDYLLEPMLNKDMDFIVQKNKFFVLGDNRNNSIDSRNIGLVDISDIIGKVIYHLQEAVWQERKEENLEAGYMQR